MTDIGDIVLYSVAPPHDPHSQITPDLLTYPAILYKWVKFDTKNEIYMAGLYVFTDDGIRQLRNVLYSKKPIDGTWRDRPKGV